MQTVTTKYLPATNTRGARIKVLWNRFVKSGGLALALYVIPQIIAVVYWEFFV